MVYLINTKTKEHIDAMTLGDSRYEQFARSPGWVVQVTDPDGWTEWRGGECPLPDGVPYETKHESGAIFQGEKPETFGVHWRGYDDAVIAYRPILDADTKPEPPAWDGEGLPPVGCECEYDDCQHGWVRTRILAHHPNGSCAWHESVEGDGFVDETSYSTDSAGAFRPIRSEGGRVVGQLMMDAELMRVQAERVYAAGYRKTGDA